MNSFWRKSGGIRLILSFLTMAILIAGCGSKQAAPQQVIAVTVSKAESRAMPIQVDTVGNVEAFNSVVIMPQVSGQVASIHFQQGQDVKANDLLVTIDPAPIEQKLEQAEAQLAHDNEQAKFNKISSQRYAYLYKENAVSQQDYDQVATASATQQATVWQSQAAVRGAQIDLTNCYIRSPIAGRTGAFLANLGTMTTANQTQLVVINQLEPIFVKFTVPEKYLASIIAAQQIAALQVTVSIADQGGTVTDGVLTFIDNTVDVSSGVVQLKAQFPNSTRQLWPGQFVRVTIKLGEQPDAIVVPSEAVMDGQNGTYVFVAKDDMTVEARPVVRDRVIGNFAVITQGLAADETIVIDGQVNLGPGAKISIKEAPAQPAVAGSDTQANTQGGGGQ
jgi:multidrug efflux system membrane fusion protein